MNGCIELSKKIMFVKELEQVSIMLAVWAQDKMFVHEWSISDVKANIRCAMKVCERD